jgi:DNA-binding response OmpR family regulator
MGTALVVEDEFGMADVLDMILTDEGYRVITACNGKQGLEGLAEETPDVILLGFMMPILSGDGMLRAMAAQPAYHRIPVIMMSSLEEDMIAGRCSGCTAFLHKPFRAVAVLGAVASILDNRGNDSA